MFGSVVSGISSMQNLLGNDLSNASSAANLANQLGHNVSGQSGNLSSSALFSLNADLQREFAQNSVRWRVNDAIEAWKQYKIHPLVSLGAQTHAANPVSVGSDSFSAGPHGQSIGVLASQRKLSAQQEESNALDLQAKKLDVDYKRFALQQAVMGSSAAINQQPGLPPARPVIQPNGRIVPIPTGDISFESPFKVLPAEVVATSSDPSAEAAPRASRKFEVNAGGGFDPVMTQDSSESYESMTGAGSRWMVQNYLMPSLNRAWFRPPADVPLAKGHIWDFDGLRGYYQRLPSLRERVVRSDPLSVYVPLNLRGPRKNSVLMYNRATPAYRRGIYR